MRTVFIRKDHSWLMRSIGWVLETTGITKGFMTRFWTTIGNRIYYPAHVDEPHSERYFGVREHEKMHVVQAYALGLGFLWPLGTVFMALAYILLPLPIFFSGRWLLERGPYLADIKRGRFGLDQVVNNLHNNYLRPWPRRWMRQWFCDRLTHEEYLKAVHLDHQRNEERSDGGVPCK